MNFRQNTSEPSEIVIGLIGPIGCNRPMIAKTIENLAKHYSYRTEVVSMSSLINEHVTVPDHCGDNYKRVIDLMNAGNELRGRSKDSSLLAKLAAAKIAEKRDGQADRRVIYIIDSIKRPEEVEELRNIYGVGFYLFAAHSSAKSRQLYLEKQCSVHEREKRDDLIKRDRGEDNIDYGQSTSAAFHLADFFFTENGDEHKVWNSLERFFDIIFGDPFRTPTFHEYAMFMAHAAGMKSADMSRQVGAVITRNKDIVSTGANECPSPEGGTYWPTFDEKTNVIGDISNGRDYMNGIDRNAKEKQTIINSLRKGLRGAALAHLERNIESSGLMDISEYGRVVHAEMDAILGCARRGIGCDGAVIFCTTFPCHNCAKHIIASGIRDVVFIEPYPKSKAYEMHPDAIRSPEDQKDNKVLFQPFVGVGPRQFINLFSLSLGSGQKIKRKQKDGFEKAAWLRKNAVPRVKAFSISYLEKEESVKNEADELLKTVAVI
ncbi:anti-phage dCTP deaminase [Janthinobacterium sp. NFX145]|uniref:anti-phage dCTP deaminase n=1 Tax=Janthinobacterium sp. NFX145 TaxID=3415602 RepID=UPI003CC5BD5C